jgi:hypothetical protein
MYTYLQSIPSSLSLDDYTRHFLNMAPTFQPYDVKTIACVCFVGADLSISLHIFENEHHQFSTLRVGATFSLYLRKYAEIIKFFIASKPPAWKMEFEWHRLVRIGRSNCLRRACSTMDHSVS